MVQSFVQKVTLTLWQHNSISMGMEVAVREERLRVLEGVENNSKLFFTSVCEKWLSRRERGPNCYYLPSLHPSINPSSHTHTHTHENTHRFSQLQ